MAIDVIKYEIHDKSVQRGGCFGNSADTETDRDLLCDNTYPLNIKFSVINDVSCGSEFQRTSMCRTRIYFSDLMHDRTVIYIIT
jgi:hypothetical protein